MTAEGAPNITTYATSSDVLCANLRQGMHAVAQPLTILRGSLFKAHVDQLGLVECRELAESSGRQVERLCTLFSYLQQFVLTESTKPVLTATHVSSLLAFVADGVRLLFEDAGMSLKLTVPEIERAVLIDTSRTHQALSSVLLTIFASSKAKDTIDLIVSSSAESLCITVLNTSSSGDRVNAEGMLSLALAEANIRSAGGGFTYTAPPFSVEIQLPYAELIH